MASERIFVQPVAWARKQAAVTTLADEAAAARMLAAERGAEQIGASVDALRSDLRVHPGTALFARSRCSGSRRERSRPEPAWPRPAAAQSDAAATETPKDVVVGFDQARAGGG
jgi:hypothetical protein